MIKLTFKIEDQKAYRKIEEVRKQIPFATALALTKTAQAIKEDLVAGMSSAFSNPTTYTLRSMYVKRAEKTELVASVGVKGGDTGEGAVRWLRPEIYGGSRQYALEAILEPLGLPPAGMYAVPGKAAKLSNGHIDINWVRALVSDIAEQGIGQARGILTSKFKRRKGKTLNYVVLMTKWGKLLPGIYGKRGGSLFPFIIFVRQPKYGARFNFYGIAEATAQRQFPIEFAKAVERSLSTAR
jgi:hypothetical protein